MKSVFVTSAFVFAIVASPALAVEGQPAAPSGAPKAAAESGSSEAGKAASTNEMKSNNERKGSQDKAGDPHKM